MRTILLPTVVPAFHKAHEALKQHYAATGMKFTLDGRLVGDVGEAIATECFGLLPCKKRTAGVDRLGPDGVMTVQVKATGQLDAGSAFSPGEGEAQHLLFIRIDFAGGTATVAYNGPEGPIRAMLGKPLNIAKSTQRVNLARVMKEDKGVPPDKRLDWAGLQQSDGISRPSFSQG